MGMRITILLDAEFMKKIRQHQAKLIQKTKKAVSFSKVLNDVLKEGYKLSAITDTRGLPITPFGFNIKTGKLFFFQHSKWLS